MCSRCNVAIEEADGAMARGRATSREARSLPDRQIPPVRLAPSARVDCPRMTACTNPPNRPPREVIDRLIDAVAWAKTCMLVTAATDPKSPQRVTELEKLRTAVVEPRRVVDEVFDKGQSLPRVVLVDLRTCELAIPKLEAGEVLRQPDGAA